MQNRCMQNANSIAKTANRQHNGGVLTRKHPKMTTTDIAARLRALASDDKQRPETARLRDVFDDVERALQAGVKQAVVLAELHELGFTMTMASFKSALQRIRKERAEGALPASSTRPTAWPATQPATAQGAAKAANLDERKMPEEAPGETAPGDANSEKRKILSRKDLRKAKQSGNDELDQFINK